MALVGSPNVGKSSLMNALLSTDRAIVTEIPGTTRDVLEESFDLDGVPIVLNDTAGLRETRDPVETLGVERSSRALEAADAAVLVLDASRPLLSNDEAAAQRVRRAAKPTIVALNKRDLPHAVRVDDARDLVPGAPVVHTSAIREDVNELRRALRHVIGLAGGNGAWPWWPAFVTRKPSPEPATNSPAPAAPWPKTNRPTSSASASAAPSTPSAKSPANPPPKTCSTSSSRNSASASKPPRPG